MNDIFIRSNDYLHRIELDDVYFFTRHNGKVIAVLKNNRAELSISLYALNELIGKSKYFFRCHKSYIVNIRKIKDISKYSDKTYNIRFNDIKDVAYITQKNLNFLKEKFLVI